MPEEEVVLLHSKQSVEDRRLEWDRERDAARRRALGRTAVVAGALLLILAWLYRWDVVPVNSNAGLRAVVIDRWTGRLSGLWPNGELVSLTRDEPSRK
jgi:hypothetical protein